MAGEDDRHAPAALVEEGIGERVDADGSRPENGSSRISTSGRLTRAAASWTRCWLPSESFSTDPPPLTEAEPVHPLGGRPRGRGGVEAVQPREVGDLLADLHLRIEAALLRHVADPPSGVLGPAGRPCQRTRPGVGADQTHGDPHRGGLAGLRSSRRSRTSPRGDGEAHAFEHPVGPEALVQPVELEHAAPSLRFPVPHGNGRLPSRRDPSCGVIRRHERGERAGTAAERCRARRAACRCRRLPGVRAAEAGDPDGLRRGTGERADRLRRRAARRPGGPEGRAVRRAGQEAARPGARGRRHRPRRRLRHQRGQALPVHRQGQAAHPPDAPGPSTCARADRGWRRSSSSSSRRSWCASARRRPRR